MHDPDPDDQDDSITDYEEGVDDITEDVMAEDDEEDQDT